jgi:cell division protein FtsQ
VLIGAAVALLLGLALYAWRGGLVGQAAMLVAEAHHEAILLTGRLGLRVDEVFVEGRTETAADQVLAAIGARRGTPILAVDPMQAKTRLEQLPWVRAAAVERRLPDAIHVRIFERQPLALWQYRKRMVLIDRDGTEIRGADIRRFARLPLVVGDDAPRHASALLALLATEPDLQRRVSAAIRVAGRRWNLRLDNGIDVQLPENNAGAAWMRLAELEREQRVLASKVSLIDLRLADRMIVRVVREAPAATPAPAPRRGAIPGRPT